jgi:hypothetical protein
MLVMKQVKKVQMSLTDMKIGISGFGKGRDTPKLAFTYTVFVTVVAGGVLSPPASVGTGVVCAVPRSAVKPCEVQ